MSTVYIIGAGPGRADLLTVRAARLLARADAVLYDRLVSREVLDMVCPGAEMIDAGKEEGRQEEIQSTILTMLEDRAKRYEVIIRLKGGDPMVFGRGAEEWAWLVKRGITVEVVPGVSSAVSVPELAGIPVTYRGISGGFAVVTGHRRQGLRQHWAAYAKVDTLVVLMGVAQRAEIAACLIECGKLPQTPAAFIENGTTPRERVIVTTLAEIAGGRIAVESPAVLVIGDVVRLREHLREAVDLHAGVDLFGLVKSCEAHAGQAR